GPNGAGKTTTMRLLTGFLHPSAGSIRMAGHDMADESERLAARRKIGYLPETTPLYNEMLVSEYLSFMGRVHGLEGEHLERRARELLELLELGSHFFTPIGLLSKGFRQRIALAATLIHQPEIIILDEPTSGLDPNQIAHIRKLIRELGESATLILSTHILQEVEDICDRVIIISNGRIVADDETARLRQSANQLSCGVVVKAGSEARSRLESLAPVGSVREAGPADDLEAPDGYQGWVCELKSGQPEELFQALAASGLAVRSLQPVTRSLEDIFKELTN
ncbi:MAG: ATP-binding cassette domain-containing protein, partial [Leptospiraceae bacterium]|nr:ATP-binding cassette domain-containing protein [Leptospiraceae bacterium]